MHAETASPNESAVAIEDIANCFDDVFESNRRAWQMWMQFAREDAFAFHNRQMENFHASMSHLQKPQGISGFVDAQHAWAQEIGRDYHAQMLRYAAVSRDIMNSALAAASDAAAILFDEANKAAKQQQAAVADMQAKGAEAAEGMAHHAADAVNKAASQFGNAGELGKETAIRASEDVLEHRQELH